MGLRSYPEYGPFGNVVGAQISSVTPIITSPMHHVITTAELTTLTPPINNLGFIGPTYLVADSLYKWTSSGNIAAPPGTTLIVNHAYGFVYDRTTGKWYPIGLPAVAS